jgi:hypothetical protein
MFGCAQSIPQGEIKISQSKLVPVSVEWFNTIRSLLVFLNSGLLTKTSDVCNTNENNIAESVKPIVVVRSDSRFKKNQRQRNTTPNHHSEQAKNKHCGALPKHDVIG